MKIKIPAKLQSRKLWLPLIAGLIVGLNDVLNWGLDEGTINKFVTLAVAYVFGEGIVDYGRARNNK